MYELRWILLLAGVVLVVGLWIHETRRTKAAERARQRDPGAERVDPWVAEDVAAPDRTAVEMPQIRATSADRVSPPLNPPVIEIPAGVEPELSRSASVRGDDTLAGAVPVVDATEKLVGILTDRDVCMAAYTRGVTLHEMRVGSLMSRHVRTCHPTDRISDAERTVLSHWIVIDGGKTENYQCVVPSTWNAGPRNQNDALGPYEAALVGNPVVDPEKPLEVLRTIHSFDPCLACAIHMVNGRRIELARVKAL